MKRATSREPDEVKLLGLIGDIYRAAEDSSQWSTFLKHASATVGGRFSLILLQDRRTQALDFSLFEGADPEMIRLYTEHYAEQDFWLAHGPHLPSGTVVRGSDLFPLGSMPGTSFYEELMHPFEIEGMLGAIIAGSDALEQFAYLSIVQTRERDDFSEREVDSVRALMPHLQNAWAIQRRLRAAALQRELSHRALDQLPDGVILFESGERTSFFNRAAERALRLCDGLAVRLGRLRLGTPREQSSFDSLLRQALLASQGCTLESGGILRVARPSGKRPWILRVAPLASDHRLVTGQTAAAIVLVYDLDSTPEPAADVLRSTFGLTATETRFARELATGSDLATIAERLCMTIQTARTHLKRVMSKTDTRRQSQLIRLLLQIPSYLDED